MAICTWLSMHCSEAACLTSKDQDSGYSHSLQGLDCSLPVGYTRVSHPSYRIWE